MIIFWLVCAIFVAIALAFVLPPLMEGSSAKADASSEKEANIAVYRDQISELETDLATGIISREQFDQDRDEIERRLLDDMSSSGGVPSQTLKHAKEGRGAVYAVALGLPILVVAFYLRVGNPYGAQTVDSAASPAMETASAPAMTPAANGEMSQQRIEANVAALAKRLEQNPGDLEGWNMLARSYMSLEKYAEASSAYEKATALKANDADLWADYAFALAMASNKKLQGKPAELIGKALQIDPENPKALELAGSAAFEAHDYKRAIEYWQKLLERLPANSEVAESLTQRINEAKKRAGGDETK
ncbi:MAG: c-type cytochrome biogenesis protein CcmI [Pyrinomonadaceae bacterium]|nr:c-type cytochrome biogenesis protein CcmI [Pyrinomonadaceae bacterium]